MSATEPIGSDPVFLASMLVDGPPDARRRALATAITLVESCRDEDRARQETLLTSILPWTGDAVRLGVSGPPGAGKSSLIDVLGTYLLEHRDVRVAVLAIDPSSTRSGGSILGDKTRMERLAARPGAFIRPSPSGGAAGGVAPATREAILLCEAAGYHVVIVETVGSGQGEIAVSTMTDVFAVVQPPFSGDGLQAVKRGMMEAADLLVVTKTDIDPQAAATAMLELSATLAATRAVPPPVLGFTTVSAEASGCAASMWEAVDTLHAASRADGRLAERRAGQQAAWMWERIEAGLRRQFVDDPRVAAALPAMLDAVRAGSTTPTAAAATLLELVRHRP